MLMITVMYAGCLPEKIGERKPMTLRECGFKHVLCVKCFVDVDLDICEGVLPYCVRCWDVGSKVKDKVTGEEFVVVKLYTFHFGKYGTMTRVREQQHGATYEYFNERLELLS